MHTHTTGIQNHKDLAHLILGCPISILVVYSDELFTICSTSVVYSIKGHPTCSLNACSDMSLTSVQLSMRGQNVLVETQQ